jgi:hypothetical protein
VPTPPTTGQVILDTGPTGTPIPLLLSPGTYARGESTIWARAPERQGDPINLGPASTWKQESFEGGLGQSRWRDAKMYYTGTSDTRDGTIRCRWGLDQIPGAPAVADNSKKIFAVRPVNEGDVPNLYYAQVGIAPAKVHALANPNGPHAERFATVTSTITAMARSFSGGMYGLHIGLNTGKFYLFHSGSITAVNDPVTDLTCSINMIVGGLGKGDIAGCGADLYKWSVSKWVKIGYVGLGMRGGAYWNQRFFFIATDDHGRSVLYTTDMLTIQPVHEWPNNFVGTGVAVHYGRIYIVGYTGHSSFVGDEGRGRRGQLWAYNGNSMDLIYQIPEYMTGVGEDIHPNYHFYGPSSYNKWLIWGHGNRGVFFYDPETDSVHPGTFIGGAESGTGNWISETAVWQGRIVAGVFNARYPRWDSPSFRHYASSTLITSEFDAGLSGQDKVWTELRVRFAEPIPAGTTVQVHATTQRVEGDNGGAAPWVSLGTISSVLNINNTGDGGLLRIAGDINFPDFRSRVIRLRFTLTPTTYSAGVTNKTPEIAGFELDYFFTDNFKSGWTFVAEAVDVEDVRRPDGNEYTYTPAEVEALMWALRTNATKQVFEYTDKDGSKYQVKMVALTQSTDVPQELIEDGEISENHSFAVGLAEV